MTKQILIYIKFFLNLKFWEKIDKNISIKNPNLSINKFNEKTINIVSNEITNLVKSQNLIDIRTPSFFEYQASIRP